MPATETNQQGPPSLRIEELAITNFRTFRERTVIPFCRPQGAADTIAVFHGDNGSGKSNALAALDLFFQTAMLSLRQTSEGGDITLPWDMEYSITGVSGDRGLVLAYQDRPHGSEGPMEIEIRFSDSRLGRLRSVCTPSGDRVRVQLLRAVSDDTIAPIPREERDQLVTWVSTPKGPHSRALTIVDARRWQPGFLSISDSLMPPELADSLFGLRTSRNPQARNLWRAFVRLLGRFSAFKGKEVSIEPATTGGSDVENAAQVYEIVVEDRGRTVLGLGELSSGEQHIIVLCAASLLSRAAVLAIQEPEISIDATNQRLLRDILDELSHKGLVDQIILESHVQFFDGPDVIRFHRDASGATRVTRQPSHGETAREIERKATEQGAKQRWVTRGGYTQLPEKMVDELAVQEGGHVWFLKGKNHWEAWPEAEVDDYFGGGESDDD